MLRPPKYPRHGELREVLNESVEAYFVDNQLSKTGGWRFLRKSLLLAAWFALSYVAMLFWAEAWWLVGLCAVSLGLAHAGIGFSIMHDGGHGAVSRYRWANKLAAASLDFIGGSSRLWAFKHNVIHHQYPNVDGVDHDIIVEPWLRLTETQTRRRMHRGQFVYFPLAYAFLTAKWLLHDDFRTLMTNRLGAIQRPPIRRRQIAAIIGWKLWALGWIFALPIAVHGVAWTAAVFVVWAAVSGIALATVFQLAHAVDQTEIAALPEEGARLERTWAEQQLASTVDFAHGNPIVTWYVGGLNYQIEHHLFPRISHVHYPAIAPIVREVCAELGVPYRVNPSMWAALKSHVRHLRVLGQRG